MKKKFQTNMNWKKEDFAGLLKDNSIRSSKSTKSIRPAKILKNFTISLLLIKKSKTSHRKKVPGISRYLSKRNYLLKQKQNQP
jgi:hypothetical protein